MKKLDFSGVHKCLEPLLKNGVERGVFSGVAVGVYRTKNKEGEKLIFCQGKTLNNTQAKPIKETTLFDLASLTKPLCTVLCILHLIEEKKVSFDTEIESCLDRKKTQILKNIQIAHLMSHSAGLKAYSPYYLDFQPVQGKGNKEKLFNTIFQEKPIHQPGMKCEYSDLGYLLLGEVVENVSGYRLDEFFSSTIAAPLGLEKKILFRPIDEYGKKREDNIAATQMCPWRKRVLQGEVDDEHSWLLNGVAGHAGLFGSIHGVLDMCVHILRQWKGREEHPSYSNFLLNHALTRKYAQESWCLGFDTPSASGSSGGKYVSKESVGHLGFTGTSFWIDPEKEVVVVLLTNRVHPNRNNEKIKKFRPLFHDNVFSALEGNKKAPADKGRGFKR